MRRVGFCFLRGQLAGLSGAGIAKGRRVSHATKDQQLAVSWYRSTETSIWVKCHRLCWEFGLNRVLNGFGGVLFKVSFLKYSLQMNRGLLSYYLSCLATWRRWNDAEYSSAQFGLWQLLKQQLVSTSCWKLPSSSACHCCCPWERTVLPGPAQAPAGEDKMMGFCRFLTPGPGCVPAAADTFTLRNGFALQSPSQSSDVSAETMAVHLQSARWREESVTVFSAAVNWRSYMSSWKSFLQGQSLEAM